jgi:hypothetical protein
MSRSEFFDEGWCASVEVEGDTVTIDLLLLGLGVAGRARLVLPVRGYADALAALAAVIYSDELLLRHAVRVHLDQHPPTQSKERESVADVARVPGVARLAVQRTCARRSRR